MESLKTRGLIIFARKPRPGRVKTRLARAIGAEGAAALYGAMLADVLEQAASLDTVRPLVFWTPDSGRLPDFHGLPRLEMYTQSGADLGERMANAFAYAFANGIDTCCIIGTDSPDLPPAHIMEAFLLLERGMADVVMGPASDGGYYLLGMRRPCRRLFAGIPWGTPQVLEQSRKRADELCLSTSLLPIWHDIDTMDDVWRLDRTPGPEAPCTREAIRRLEGIMRRGVTDNIRRKAGAP